jgi:hypothetical protein
VDATPGKKEGGETGKYQIVPLLNLCRDVIDGNGHAANVAKIC